MLVILGIRGDFYALGDRGVFFYVDIILDASGVALELGGSLVRGERTVFF